MTALTNHLSDIVGKTFEALELPAELGSVQVSDRPDLAQFQCNGAMSAAKIARKNPREIAQGICDALSQNEIFSNIEVAGPGFINLTVSDEFLASFLEKIDHKSGGIIPVQSQETVIIDYAQPNVAKPMHVGHLRSSIIGESLKRLHQVMGYNVIGDIHLGDWGTHMGMVISEYIKLDKTADILAIDEDDPITVQALLDELLEVYPRVSRACKDNPECLEEAKSATVKIQNKEEPYYGLWEKIRNVSIAGQKRNFALLEVEFDLWWGESTSHDTIAPMVDDLKSRGLAVEDDGAVIFPVAEEDDKKEMPPVILYKRDGGVMYGTTDLACIIDRMRDYSPSKILYVVDARQSLHFEQLFRAARKAGFVDDTTELTHAGFGTMNGTDGKPFKTRAGGVMKLEDLLQTAIEKAKARLDEAELAQDYSDEEKVEIARKVAVAAVKFADLQNNRTADYVFDLDRMTSFEGKTGPYLLYQSVRLRSLLEKAGSEGQDASLVIREEDRSLALHLAEFPSAVSGALQHYTPHILADYIFKLAQNFSRFYGQCHILSESDEALKASRLKLCSQTLSVLLKGLALLGISVPRRM